MTESELSREIKNAAVGGVYFFYGEEDYTKNHRAEAICNLVSGGDASLAAFNVIKLRFDDRGVDMSKISDAMLSPPLMSPMKAVHVHIAFVDAMTEKEKTALVEQVEEYASDGFSDCVLVITCSQSCRNMQNASASTTRATQSSRSGWAGTLPSTDSRSRWVCPR